MRPESPQTASPPGPDRAPGDAQPRSQHTPRPDPGALAQLERLGTAHPKLVELGRDPLVGSFVAPAARTLALRLVGAPVTAADPLSSLLQTLAGPELAWLEAACSGQPLRAAAVTADLLASVVTQYRHLLEHQSPLDPIPPSGSPVDADAELCRLRDSLQTLSGRRLPETFPLPSPRLLPTSLATDGPQAAPDRVGAALARALEIPRLAEAALSAASVQEHALDALAVLLPGFGWDYGRGQLQQTLLAQLSWLVKLLLRLPILRRIAEELGRLEGPHRAVVKAERGGREEVVGVRVGGELADVLPVELALLGDPDTEDLFYQRYLEHRLMCLELQGPQVPQEGGGRSRGPVLACVDTSASMQGAPEAVSKALILSVIRRVLPQKRPVRLLLFGGPDELLELDVQPGHRSVEPLLHFLSLGFQGGTDFDRPLERALACLSSPTYMTADVLLLTDGLGAPGHAVREQLLTQKLSKKFRVFSVVVGGDARGIEEISDRVWRVDPGQGLGRELELRSWRQSF